MTFKEWFVALYVKRGFVRSEKELEEAFAAGAAAEREACAALCSEVGQQPSSLWHEHGCWTHAAQVCAESIALRSNA